MESSLFIKYGGFSRIYKVIEKFYDNILKSETLNAHFKHTNMERLIHHQTSFISSLMGGPDYAHWHGFFELMQDMYKIKRIYKNRMESGKIEE